jgi:hypothetical protein
MRLVDQRVVRELVQSQDPDAALVFTGGDCVVVSVGETVEPETGVLIVRRREIAGVCGEPVGEDRLRVLAHCLDNRARDLGA